MAIVYKEVEIEISLDDFTTEDLIDELAERGKSIDDTCDLYNIWQLKREGKSFDKELDTYLYKVIGRAI